MEETDQTHDGVPTIATVARLANVSVASASRVLNGIRTSPDTFARVTEAAEEVGYAPNAAARSLRSRRTGQIAFAMPDVGNPVYTTMVGSIQEVARARGLRLLLHSTGADVEDELAMVRDLKHRFVDGLILASLDLTGAHTEELRRAAAPVVVIGRPTKGTPVDVVRAHSRKGAAAGGAPPARGRTPSDRVRQRARSTRCREPCAGWATSTASARAVSPRDDDADRGRGRLHDRARPQRDRAPARASAP